MKEAFCLAGCILVLIMGLMVWMGSMIAAIGG
ncbi:hypothetical protein ES705_23726 [subsurface metagenome]